MNEKEFGEWFGYHCSQFPQVSKWASSGANPDAWQEALEQYQIGFHEAKTATKAMIAGAGDKTFHASDHPEVIIKAVLVNRSKIRAAEKLHSKRCNLCCNGWIMIESPRAMQLAIWAQPIPFDIRAARCRCAPGDDDKHHKPVLTYRSDLMIEYDLDHVGLKEWAAKWWLTELKRRDETGGMIKGTAFTGDETLPYKDEEF